MEEDKKDAEPPDVDAVLNSSDLTIKCSLKRLLKKNEEIIKVIQAAVIRMNQIITEVYHLLNLHIRRLLEGKQSIPNMDNSCVRKFIQATSTLHGTHSLPDDEEICKTFRDLYLPLLGNRKLAEYFEPRDNLSDCIDYAAVEMLTSIKNNIQVQRVWLNNIQVHFISRQMNFLRRQSPKVEKKYLWEKLMRENEAGQAENAAHVAYLPDHLKESVWKELKLNPFQFLHPMYEMDKFLEDQNAKTFALIPLRHGFIPKSIRITTRDFTKLVKQAGFEVPKKEKTEHPLLSDEDIFIAYKQIKVKEIQT